MSFSFFKSITQLDNQRQSINSKINLELKILETTNILQSNPTDNLVHFPTKFKQLHQQKESIQSQLSKQQTSLLQHLAAVLAQGFKRIEQQLLNSNNPHSSIHHQPSPIEPQPHSPSTAPTTLSSRSVTLSSRFDGPHLFVNKQTRPTLQTPYRAKEPPDRLPFSSPSSSPQLNNYTNSNLLKQEIESLKALLNARDAIVAEQAADLSLLELEVETLKQSLADQSNNHQQLASARSSSERNTQKELDRLNAENAQLIEQLQSSKNQTESSNYELKRLKNEMEIIHSDRQLERMSELNENLATRARDAEEHTRKIEIAKAELETQLVSLKADLEAARRSNETAAELESQLAVLKIDLQAARLSKDSALDERDSLQNNFKACQSQIEALSSELEILRTSAADQTSKHDRQCAALEATNRAEWESLASLLMSLRSKLDHKMSPKLAQFLSQSHDLTQPNKFAEGLVNCLEEYMTITNQALASQQDLGPALRAELDEARRTHDQQTVELTSRLKELEEQQTQLQQRNKELETAQEQRAAGENGKVDASELDAVKRELVAVKQQLVTAREPSTPVENRLREIWRMLPPNLEARGAASLDTDLSGFKAVYEQPKKVVTSGVTGGLGGLFGLGKRTPTPTTTTNTSTTSSTLSATDEQEFSVENTLEKLKLLVENDKKLVDRLFKYEAEKDSHKNNSIRAQKLVAESQDALRVYQSQVCFSHFPLLFFFKRKTALLIFFFFLLLLQGERVGGKIGICRHTIGCDARESECECDLMLLNNK